MSEKNEGAKMYARHQQIAFILILLLPNVSWAGNSVVCNARGNQLELNACADAELIKADKELNDVYQLLVKKMADDLLFIKRLRSAQRAWVVFRDAELEARFSCPEGDVRQCFGSMYPMLWSARKAELTRERARDLQQLLVNGLGQ